MGRLKQCTDQQLTNELVDRLRQHTGMTKIAPIFREMGNSPAALNAYLSMEQALDSGSLTEREIEAVKLAVSQMNKCDFCLSVHSVKATAAGLDKDQQQAIRRSSDASASQDGEAVGDQRIDALLDIVRCFFISPGTLSQDQLDKARQAGLSDENLVDLTLAVSTIMLTNTFNHLNDTDLIFPPAPVITN